MRKRDDIVMLCLLVKIMDWASGTSVNHGSLPIITSWHTHTLNSQHIKVNESCSAKEKLF